MANLDGLYAEDERQKAVADHQFGTLVALAGPGTGKTYSFLLRIRELTENRGIDSARICYLTFIREIARAFKDDLRLKYPGAVPPQRIAAYTLHSLACRLIRNRGFSVRLGGYLHILNLADDGDPVVRIALADMMFALPGNTTIRTATAMRGHFKNVKTEWQNATAAGCVTGDNAVAKRTYDQYSRAFKLLDWDEVIPLATALYSAADKPDWIQQYQHLLIDEYQDFNVAEQVFLGLISKSVVSRVIVGDDDQSIYGGRGARPDGIRRLVQDPAANSISLVQCRRCHEQIVRCINSFLSYMHADARQLRAVKPGGVVSVKSFRSAVAEVDYLVEQITVILSQINENTPPEDGVACLFPSHRVMAQYREEFERRGLKCKCRDSSKSLDDRMWVRILATLAFQREQPFLERLVLERFPGLTPRHKKEVVLALQNGHTSVRAALSSVGSSSGWGKAALDAIAQYEDFVACLTSRDAARVAACIDSVLPSGRQCDPMYVDLFLATADEVTLDDSLDAFVAQVFRNDDNQNTQGNFEPAVELLTMHSSKGLTRRYVVLPGMEGGKERYWLPGDAVGEKLEECKRLFLVAISRASESLLITYPRTRSRGDSLIFQNPRGRELSDFAKHLASP